jgi:serine protease
MSRLNNKKVESSTVDRSVVLIVWHLLLTLSLLCSTEIATADYRLIVRLLGQDAITLDTTDVEQAVTGLGERTRSRLILVRQAGRDALLLSAPDISTITERDELLGQLRADPQVDYVRTDRRARIQFVPNDPLYVDQWNLYEDSGGIRMPSAWDVERGRQEIVTAIIDTGILPHAELDSARFLPGSDFVSDVINDNDGTPGRDADPADPGDATLADECGDGGSPTNSSWHGTGIVGVIAATTDNALDIVGIDHRGRILVARALGKCGGYISDIIDAMRWAAGLKVSGVPLNPNPARVINLSAGSTDVCSAFEQDAIDEVVSSGVSVVVAAGNDAADVSISSPANCNSVITVAATTRSGARAGYTNIGNRVDISAPGGESANAIPVLNNTGLTDPGDDVIAYALGTSFATAQVAGVAALILAHNTELSPRQVEEILKSSARPFPDTSCDTTTCGAGIVDAERALVIAENTLPEMPATDTVVSSGGGGGGGGGCTIRTKASVDSSWLLIIIGFGIGFMRQRHIKH